MAECPKNNDPIFDKVVYIGPDIRCVGGIASVLRSYRDSMTHFHHLSTNSQHGKAIGWLKAATIFFTLPVERIKGRKIAHIHFAAKGSWVRKKLIFKLARLLKFKTIMHCHTGEIIDKINNEGKEGIYNVLSRADYTVALSKIWEDAFRKALELDNLRSINNIVSPVEDISPEKFKTERKGALKLCYVGVPDRRKAVDVLIDGVALAIGKGADIHLTICGEGPEVPRLKEQVERLGLGANIYFAGNVDTQQRHRYLSGSDLFVLTSHAEGVPISILEAMAEGMPILSTNVGGVADAVSDGVNGTLVGDGDIEAIAEALLKYDTNRELIGEQGRKSLELVSEFYPQRVTAQLADLYRSLLK